MLFIVFIIVLGILAFVYHTDKVKEKDDFIKRLKNPEYHSTIERNQKIAKDLSENIIGNYSQVLLQGNKYNLRYKNDSTYNGYLLDGYLDNSLFAEIKLHVFDHSHVNVHIEITKDGEITKRTSCPVIGDGYGFDGLMFVKKQIDKLISTF